MADAMTREIVEPAWEIRYPQLVLGYRKVDRIYLSKTSTGSLGRKYISVDNWIRRYDELIALIGYMTN